MNSCRDRNVGFPVVARKTPAVRAAIFRAISDPSRWAPAVRQDGKVRDGAQVAELTDLIDIQEWPQGPPPG